MSAPQTLEAAYDLVAAMVVATLADSSLSDHGLADVRVPVSGDENLALCPTRRPGAA